MGRGAFLWAAARPHIGEGAGSAPARCGAPHRDGRPAPELGTGALQPYQPFQVGQRGGCMAGLSGSGEPQQLPATKLIKPAQPTTPG